MLRIIFNKKNMINKIGNVKWRYLKPCKCMQTNKLQQLLKNNLL